MAALNLTITTFQLSDPETEESCREIDHNDPLHRTWLQKHIFWAVRNGRGVEISARVPL
jgi:hypothetical protein